MAVAAKAKGPVSDSIMTTDKMKPLLALSKKEPVQAAIGMTTDGEGLILLDKKAKPKKVLAMLQGEARKAKIALNTASLRFGRAMVDTENDPGTIIFSVNKEAPGALRTKLLEVIKRIPYQKCEINVDAALETEPEEEAESEEPNTASGEGTMPAAPGPDAAAALTAALANLIRQVAGTQNIDAAAKAALAKLANDANVQIKAGELAAAGTSITQLRTALAAPQAASSVPAAGGGLREAMVDWQTHRGTAITSLKAVAGQIAAAKHASSTKAIIEIQAVIKNLTAEPSTLQQITELQRWLDGDEVVQDVCDLVEDVRTPLLESLRRLRDLLPA